VSTTVTLVETSGSAELVALTMAVAGLGKEAGAVYRPEALMLPTVADQVTAVLELPVTVAANCWTPVTGTVALAGATATVTVGVLIVTLTGALVVAPGAGFTALTCAAPTREAGIVPVTVRVVEFTNVAVNVWLLIWTVAPGTNPDPLMLSETAPRQMSRDKRSTRRSGVS